VDYKLETPRPSFSDKTKKMKIVMVITALLVVVGLMTAINWFTHPIIPEQHKANALRALFWCKENRSYEAQDSSMCFECVNWYMEAHNLSDYPVYCPCDRCGEHF
jgi:uncharacterized membrane protein